MKVIELLKVIAPVGTYVIYWSNDYSEDVPLWEGDIIDTPYWLIDLELPTADETEDGEEAVRFRDNLGKEYNNRSGLVIIVKE